MKCIINITLFLLILLSLSIFSVSAQPSEPGYPAALRYHLPISSVPVIILPYFDNEELIAKDTCAECGEGYGVDANVSFDFWEKSRLQIIDNQFEKVEIYRVMAVSPTAEALHVLFNHFELFPDELMFIYSPNDSLRVLGAFSMHNNKPDSTFISNFIADNTLIIEINRRPKVLNQERGVVKVQKFLHVYKDRWSFGNALGCHENVICAPWYNEWCNQIRSVVKFVRYQHDRGSNANQWRTCTGVVVNNLSNNFEPLILTAHHCTLDGDQLPFWFAYFNYQSITCDPSTNGNDLMFVSGIDVIADDHDNSGCPDIAIMRLRQEIPLQYNVFYSGWNRRAWSSLPNDGRGIGIHHPAGDVKKISEGYRVNPLLSSCVKVNWTTGYTEGGSSGSPLFVTSREIIGVLSWGWHTEDDCDDDANFFYSWLNKSWSTLSPFLAPSNEEALTHTGIDPISACQPIIYLNNQFFPGDDWQIKNQITIQAAQQVNVANVTPTVIGNSEPGHFITQHNSDYIIRAGNRITISPGFKINAPDRIGSSGIYSGTFTFGNQNRVSFQIAPCTPFIDDCGFNHQNASVVQGTPKGSGWDVLNVSNAGAISMQGVNIYPNPVSHVLYITLSEEKQQGSFAIYNLMGCKVMEGGLNAGYNASDISELSAGLYLLHIKTPEGGLHYKLVKE